jgi:hypothetical protein
VELKPLTDPALEAHLAETRAFNAKIPQEAMPARWTPEAIAKARDLSQVMGGILAGRKIEGFEERTTAMARAANTRIADWLSTHTGEGSHPSPSG